MLKMIKNKYHNMPAPVKASLWFTICNILQKGISLISTPIFTRIMTPDEYGVFTVYNTWYSIFIIVGTLNVYYEVFNNGMLKYPKDQKGYTSSMQGLTSGITLLLMCLFLVFNGLWEKITHLDVIYIVPMFLEILVVPAYALWAAGQRFNYKYRKLVVVTLIMSVSAPVIGVITVLHASNKSFARICSYVAVQVTIGTFFYVYNLYKGKKIFDKNYWRFVLGFNLPLIPHYLSMTILNQSDRIMIDRLQGTGYAAIYSIAYTASMMMTIVTNAINNSFTPYIYKSIQSGKEDDIRKNSKVILMLVFLLTAIAILLGPEIISILGSQRYSEAKWIMPSLSCSVFFIFTYTMFANVSFYFEKTKFVMLATCIAAAVNLLTNYIFVPIYGFVAAGYTTLFSYVLLAAFHYTVYLNTIKKKFNGKHTYDIKLIVILSVVLFGFMLLANVLYINRPLRYVVFVAIVIYLIADRKRYKGLFRRK